jgi:hypothetical protein
MTDNIANQQPAQPAPSAQPAGIQAAGQQAGPPPGVKLLDIGAVLNGFHTRIATLEAAAKQDVSKAQTFVTKYWPVAAGIVIAVAEHFVKL